MIFLKPFEVGDKVLCGGGSLVYFPHANSLSLSLSLSKIKVRALSG